MMRDERVIAQTNAVVARLLPWMLGLQMVVLTAKLIWCGAIYCWLDVMVLAIGAGLSALLLTIKRVWRAGDEMQNEVRNACLAIAFVVMFLVALACDCIMLWGNFPDKHWHGLELVVWFVPLFVAFIQLMKKGLIQWGGKEAEKRGRRNLMIAAPFGALSFGVLMAIDRCFADGEFEVKGLLIVAVMAMLWAVVYFVLVTWIHRLGDKRADRALADAEQEASDEE